MLCLCCGHDEQSLGPACSDCGQFVGYVADGRGYLPQLKVLEVGLAEGRITPEDSEQRLERLNGALDALIGYMDECGRGLMTLELDNVQQGTMGGFMIPIREGLEHLKAAVDQLDCHGDWGEELWAQLDEAQTQVFRGNEGLNLLTETLAGYAVEKGVDLQAIFNPPEGEPEAANAE